VKDTSQPVRNGCREDPGQLLPPAVSLAIFAWNEEGAIGRTIESLLAQSLFDELPQRGGFLEVLCVANGCTDRTAEAAAAAFQQQTPTGPGRRRVATRVVDLPQRGKINAWNEFVHSLSAREARVLFMMDADIRIHRPDTLWNMYRALLASPGAHLVVDQPCKDIQFKPRHSWRERLSLAAGRNTSLASAQLCGQLYAVRAEVARAIYIPLGLSACEDGYLKTMVCTDHLQHEVWPHRIMVAPDAAHTFEAYTSPRAVLRNQKRQIIGQTILHVLIDQYLQGLPARQPGSLAQHLRARDSADRAWLHRLVATHVDRTRWFWRLHPGLCTLRLKRLQKLPWRDRARCLPAALLGTTLAVAASFMACRALRAGRADYWPKAERSTNFEGPPVSAAGANRPGPARSGASNTQPAPEAGLSETPPLNLCMEQFPKKSGG
jgi:glycosyltransferase involved in cell wall biosynthesis